MQHLEGSRKGRPPSVRVIQSTGKLAPKVTQGMKEHRVHIVSEPVPVFLPNNANIVFLTQRRKELTCRDICVSPLATQADDPSAGSNHVFTSGKGTFGSGALPLRLDIRTRASLSG